MEKNGCMCFTRKVFKPKDACRNSNRLKNRESEEIPIFIEEYKCMGEALRRIT